MSKSLSSSLLNSQLNTHENQKNQLLNRWTWLEFVLLIIGSLLSFLMFKTLMIHTDNTQLMDKVYKILTTGEWVHHGNAATKMGALPGSFLTVVTAVPMMLWNSPYAACLVIYVFHLASYFVLRNLGFKYVRDFNPLYLVVFYWLNPWRIEQSELYNPGYLFLFSALYFYFIYQLHLRKNFWDSLFLVLVVGFCFQVHFSVLILGISFLYLFLRKQIKVHYLGFATGVVLIGLSLVPWALEKISGQTDSLQTHSGAFIGKNLVLVYPVLKAIAYFFRMGSLYCGRHIFSEIRFDYIQTEWLKAIISFVFHSVKWVLAVMSLYLSFRFFGQKIKAYKSNLNRNFWSEFLISFLVGTILSAALSPVEFNHWHFILCFPVIAFFMASEPDKYFGVNFWPKHSAMLTKIALVVFIIWGLLMSFGSRSHSIFNNYEQAYRQLYKF